MPYDFAAHNQSMVQHFLWLETINPTYAKAALQAYRACPDSLNPDILADVRAEKARRAQASVLPRP